MAYFFKSSLFTSIKRFFSTPILLTTPFIIKKYLESSSKNSLKAEVIEEIDNEYYNSDISKLMSLYYKSPHLFKNTCLFLNGSNAKTFAEEVTNLISFPLGRISCEMQSVGECKIKVLENVSNRNIIYIQNLAPPLNDSLMEMLFTVAALRRSSAKKIIVVVPYFGYSRKTDKDSTSNMPLYASLIIKLLEQMGANQIVTINLSSKHITGYSYSIPIIDLDMSCIGVSYFIEKLNNKEIPKDPIVISPHVVSVPRAKHFQQLLNLNGFESGLGFIAKSSKSSEDQIDFHVSNVNQYVGDDYNGKDIILLDNEIYTGSTLISLSKQLKKEGAGKIYAFVYHDLMNDKATEKIEDSKISELILLNTVNNDNNNSDKIVRLSVSKVIAKYIEAMINKDIQH